MQSHPSNSLRPEPSWTQRAYAAQLKDDNLLMQSSSGGFFTACAEHVIDQGGYVCGAAFSADFSVRHILSNDVEDIRRMRGSKYVLSDVRELFSEIQSVLEAKKTVLFSGTPCQVAALHKFLRFPYERLLILDLFCYGITTKAFWHAYLEYICSQYRSMPQSIFFRYKKKGCKGSRLRITFANGTIYDGAMDRDLFYVGFFRNLGMRSACFTCPFANLRRLGDISIGDYWGVERHHPELDVRNGISAVITNSRKGEVLLDSVRERLRLVETMIPSVAEKNPCLRHPTARPAEYADFQRDLSMLIFAELKEKYLHVVQPSWWRRLLHGCRRCFGFAR